MEDLLLPLKQPGLHLLDPPLPLHVDVVGPIDHDLADLRVFEQSLDRPEADDLVRDLVHDIGDLASWQDRALRAEDPHDLVSHPEPPLRGGKRRELTLYRDE